MRMWMVDPKLLCQKHLIGEHGELHKHRHCFIKKYKIDKRIFPVVQIEPENMKLRHDEIVQEMINRGYNHNSFFEQLDVSYLPDNQRFAKVNIEYNINDLKNRCEHCKKLINNN